MNKDGEIKSLERVLLFKVDRSTYDQTHCYARFTFTSLKVDSNEEESVSVQFDGLKMMETSRNHNGPVDSLSTPLYRSSLKEGYLSIGEIHASVVKVQHNAATISEE